MERDTAAELATSAASCNDPRWSRSDDSENEWSAASSDGAVEALVRAVPRGFEVSFAGHRTAADAGSAGALPRAPMLLDSADAALSFCASKLKR
jgi:hypothetical protein